jgi:hypothetical protein
MARTIVPFSIEPTDLLTPENSMVMPQTATELDEGYTRPEHTKP